jgi:hypothetical protein
MIDDVDEMIHGQPEVHRVQYSPGARHAEVKLKVPVVVECNACHPVAALDTQRFQRMGELAYPLVVVRIGISVDIFGKHRDDFFFGKVFCRPQQKRSQKQGKIHHSEDLLLYFCITMLTHVLALPENQVFFYSYIFSPSASAFTASSSTSRTSSFESVYQGEGDGFPSL